MLSVEIEEYRKVWCENLFVYVVGCVDCCVVVVSSGGLWFEIIEWFV